MNFFGLLLRLPSNNVEGFEKTLEFGILFDFFQCEPSFAPPIGTFFARAWEVLWVGFQPQILGVQQHHTSRAGGKKRQTGSEDFLHVGSRLRQPALTLEERNQCSSASFVPLAFALDIHCVHKP